MHDEPSSKDKSSESELIEKLANDLAKLADEHAKLVEEHTKQNDEHAKGMSKLEAEIAELRGGDG